MSDNPFVVPDDVNPEFPFWVTEEKDGSLTFHWDAEHKVTSIFNDWTERDFLVMLRDKSEEIIAALTEISNGNG